MTRPEERILYGARRPDGSTPFWRMPTIWAMAEGKSPTSVAIEDLNILDEVVWFGGPKDVQPTVRRIAQRARDILDADLSYPIIMTRSGDVLDGAHRIAKVYLSGQQFISAVVIDDWPAPDGTIEALEGPDLNHANRDGMIETPRLKLYRWHDRHREAFAAMHADPQVMADYGGPISEADSHEKFERYVAAQRDHRISRWAVENPDGVFLGYAGVMPRLSKDHPLGAHFEVGWRFMRNAWGRGFATESAGAALRHARQIGLREILSYTSADNERSRAVMARLNLVRAPARDFMTRTSSGEPWHGLVWVVPASL